MFRKIITLLVIIAFIYILMKVGGVEFTKGNVILHTPLTLLVIIVVIIYSFRNKFKKT